MSELDPVRKLTTERVRTPTFLKEWRKHRKLTLEVASQRAGMTAGNLSAMERGTQGYTQAGLEALARAYECEPGQLLAIDPDGRSIVSKQQIGLYLAEWRERRKLTQQQLADQLGSSDVTVSRWETGQREPNLGTQKAIAEVLDIEVADLHRHPDQPSADALLRGQPQEIVDLALKLIAAITAVPSPQRHPHTDWLTKFFGDRSADDVERMKTMLEAAFPLKSKGD